MASGVIGSLRVNLGIDTAAFSEGLRNAQSRLQKFGTQMQEIGTKFSTRLTAPISAAAALVTASVTSMARDLEQLQKSAQISNTGFEEFQKLAFAARSVGIEGEKLGDIFKDVNDKVGDFMATGGGEMADFFTNIAPKVGITADAFKKLSGPQALQLYYDSLVKAGVSQQEMTFYLEAIADEASALIPLLQNGGQAFRELGENASVLSAEDASGLKAYNDSLRAMGEAIKSLTVAIASSGVLDWITQIINKAAEWTKALAQTNPEIVKWGAVIAGLAAAIGPALVGIGLMATGIAAISAPVLAVVAGVTALTAALVAFAPQINATQAAIESFLSGAWNTFVTGWDTVVQKVNAAQAAIENFASQIVGYFANLPAQMMEIGGQIIDGLWQGLQSKWEAVKGWASSAASSVADSFRSALGIHSPSTVMAEIGRNIMQGLTNGMESMAGTVAGGAGGIAGSIESAFSGIGSSIADAIKGTKEWSDVLKDVLSTVAQIVLSGLGRSGGFGGFLSSLLGGLVGFANGGSFQVGGAGGIDSQLVAFRASPNETVSIHKPGQDMGGRSVVINAPINAPGADPAQLKRVEESVKELGRNIPKIVDQRVDTRNTRKTRA